MIRLEKLSKKYVWDMQPKMLICSKMYFICMLIRQTELWMTNKTKTGLNQKPWAKF